MTKSATEQHKLRKVTVISFHEHLFLFIETLILGKLYSLHLFYGLFHIYTSDYRINIEFSKSYSLFFKIYSSILLCKGVVKDGLPKMVGPG